MDVHPTKNVYIGIDYWPIPNCVNLQSQGIQGIQGASDVFLIVFNELSYVELTSTTHTVSDCETHTSASATHQCLQPAGCLRWLKHSKQESFSTPGLLLIKHDENTHACARFWDPGWSRTCYNSTMAGSAQATECYRCHSLCLGPECHWASGPRSSHLALPLIWLGMQLNAIECNSCRCHVKDQKSLSIEGRKQDCKGETEELWNYKRCQHLWTHPSWAWVRTKGSSMSSATWVISTRLKGSNILPLHVSQSCDTTTYINILHACRSCA